jgi:peptidyl-prolyl cis-trans isomerase C
MGKLRNVFTASAVVGLVVTGAACSKGGSTSAKKSGEVVARVNDVEITTAELQEELDKLPPYLKGRVATPEGRREFLDNMLTRRALMEEADRLGLEKDPQIARQIQEYRERLILQKLMQENIPKEPEVTEEEVRKYYDSNPDEFKESEQVRVRHVLIKVEPGQEGAKKQEARQKAEQVLRSAKRGEDFEALARQHSQDPGSANRGGDLGFFPRGRMAKPFEDTAFAMTKAGQLSDVVESQFGFHVIQFVDRQAAKEKSFEEAREQIRRRLGPQKQRDTYQSFVSNVKDKHKIVVFEDALKAMSGSKAAAPEQPKPAAKAPAADHDDHAGHDH